MAEWGNFRWLGVQARNGQIAIIVAARRIADAAFREIYVSAAAEICESRDPKGHHAKATRRIWISDHGEPCRGHIGSRAILIHL